MHLLYFTADKILLPEGLQADWAIGIHPQTGAVAEVLPLDDLYTQTPVTRLAGWLIPGLVNAHCHLELSHLKGEVPQGGGIPAFAAAIVRSRTPERQFAQTPAEAIAQALEEAWATGTVAIGDIANTTDSLKAKRNTAIYTHTFVEALGADPQAAEASLARSRAVWQAFWKAGLPCSLSPHAPYSVSSPLLAALATEAATQTEPQSIHFLEDPAEREFLAEGTGPIAHFLTRIGAYGSAAGVSPTDWLQPLLQLPPTVPLLLVHLLQATADELALLANRPNTWFVLNPRSNLFIHNTLPSHASFAPYANRLCLGTDSLASNHDLDLLAEVNTLLQADPAWDPAALLQAATLNGAEALGIGDEYGCLYPGARPGLLQIDYDAQARRFTLVRRWV